MNELARAALSFVRSRAKQLGLDLDFFNRSDIHLHIPSGAQPKDGPSAGVTIATSLVSLISGRKVKPNVGMTGEITLRYRFFPLAALKKKYWQRIAMACVPLFCQNAMSRILMMFLKRSKNP